MELASNRTYYVMINDSAALHWTRCMHLTITSPGVITMVTRWLHKEHSKQTTIKMLGSDLAEKIKAAADGSIHISIISLHVVHIFIVLLFMKGICRQLPHCIIYI